MQIMISKGKSSVNAGDLSYHLAHFLRPHCEQVCPQFFLVVDVEYERWHNAQIVNSYAYRTKKRCDYSR